MGKPDRAEDALQIVGYEVVCRQKINAMGQYVGDLRIRRKADGKLIYPFDGCLVPGPFATADEARLAVRELAKEFVRLDLERPED
ncbi:MULTISPECIES: DUF6723 family protein [Paraburkholderia]|uniref:DUF6723 family protein n=1 Tax=Paraburkholderia ferrariae TaxID=386056 RepID=A0ABU9S0W9_9BURK